MGKSIYVKELIDKQYERLEEQVEHISKKEYVARFIELDNRGYVWKGKVYQQLVAEFHIDGLTCEELLQDYINELSTAVFPLLI
ncbi:hypothetical protein J2S74_005209 [Evansella vedderi]|uniref:Uncharacterized protein n=1 Tax=Evansella vedderi TaxID=38282 RepID=A0ABU0A2N6_9BACI|nr:hypothetical protein [Evansella vedderi]MDQ0257747.1 hypothetical protein [Evansella vedderi]